MRPKIWMVALLCLLVAGAAQRADARPRHWGRGPRVNVWVGPRGGYYYPPRPRYVAPPPPPGYYYGRPAPYYYGRPHRSWYNRPQYRRGGWRRW